MAKLTVDSSMTICCSAGCNLSNGSRSRCSFAGATLRTYRHHTKKKCALKCTNHHNLTHLSNCQIAWNHSLPDSMKYRAQPPCWQKLVSEVKTGCTTPPNWTFFKRLGATFHSEQRVTQGSCVQHRSRRIFNVCHSYELQLNIFPPQNLGKPSG